MKLRKLKGFTLMELMIVLVIASILATIAIPMYTQHLVTARRADAKVALMDLAARMERYFAENHTYATATIGAGGATDVLGSDNSSEGYYQMRIVSQDDSSFVVEAAPVPGSAQEEKDTACGALRLNQAGQKSVTGTGTVQGCW